MPCRRNVIIGNRYQLMVVLVQNASQSSRPCQVYFEGAVTLLRALVDQPLLNLRHLYAGRLMLSELPRCLTMLAIRMMLTIRIMFTSRCSTFMHSVYHSGVVLT